MLSVIPEEERIALRGNQLTLRAHTAAGPTETGLLVRLERGVSPHVPGRPAAPLKWKIIVVNVLMCFIFRVSFWLTGVDLLLTTLWSLFFSTNRQPSLIRDVYICPITGRFTVRGPESVVATESGLHQKSQKSHHRCRKPPPV